MKILFSTTAVFAIVCQLIFSDVLFALNTNTQGSRNFNSKKTYNKINGASEVTAVVNYFQLPRNLKFYARDNEDSADVTFSGNLTTAGYDSVYIEVYKNNVWWKRNCKKLVYSSGISQFSISQKIHAELSEYKFKLYLKTGTTGSLIKTADSIVCGDAYIIAGQSNAHPTDPFMTYTNEYCRTFGVQTAYYNEVIYNAGDTNWALSNAHGLNRSTQPIANVGIWGLRLQKLIKETFGIPTCFINGARGGSYVEENLRNNSNPTDFNTIYGKTLYRVTKSGLSNKIKAIFWHQGESNGDATYTNYFNNFVTLYNSWKQNYPNLKKVFGFQVRPTYCSYDFASQLREAQRKLPQVIPELELMSTVGLPNYDGCHYFYYGYTNLADVIFRPVCRDFYSIIDTSDIKAPNIKYAFYTTPAKNQIALIFENSRIAGWPADTLGQSMKNYFFLNGVNGNVTGGTVSGDTLKLSLNSSSSATKITYLTSIYNYNNSQVFEGPFLRNSKKVGALSFHDFPISNYAPVTFNITMTIDGLYDTSLNLQNMDETVNIQIRNNYYPYAIKDSVSAKIDSATFTGKFVFTKLPAGTYYITVKGKNILETWSKEGGVSVTAGGTANYNFTTSESQAYGNNLILKGTKYCIYNSDLNQDGLIDGLDNLRVGNDAYSLMTGNVTSDINGDRFVDGSDVNISDINSIYFISSITPLN